MKYFSKNRFSLKQVVVMLTIVFLGIAVISYAAVTIPHTFTSGTTISSSDMNENFTAVKNVMPGAKNGNLADMTIGSTYTVVNIGHVTITAPSSGMVIFNVSGTIYVNHQSGEGWHCVLCSISDSSTIIPNNPRAAFYVIAGMPVGYMMTPLGLSKAFSVSGAGNFTGYLNCEVTNGGGTLSTVTVENVSMNAIYVPVQLL